MVLFLADENFNRNLVRALKRRQPDIDILAVQEVGLGGADDPTVLEWAATQARILLTHDVQTLPGFAYARVKAGRSMPGVVEVPIDIAMHVAANDIILIATASEPSE